MNKNLFVFIALFQILISYSQNLSDLSPTEKDSLLNIDYINKDYQFLDEDFQIKTDELKEFQASLGVVEFRENAVYKDSLRAILKYNLKHDYAVHLAFHRILTPWERTSFYVWEGVDDTKALAQSFGFEHPYLFYEFLISEKSDPQKEKLLKDLQAQLNSNLDHHETFKSNKALLLFAFKHNPDREKAMKKYFKRVNNKHKH